MLVLLCYLLFLTTILYIDLSISFSRHFIFECFFLSFSIITSSSSSFSVDFFLHIRFFSHCAKLMHSKFGECELCISMSVMRLVICCICAEKWICVIEHFVKIYFIVELKICAQPTDRQTDRPADTHGEQDRKRNRTKKSEGDRRAKAGRLCRLQIHIMLFDWIMGVDCVCLCLHRSVKTTARTYYTKYRTKQ